MTFAELVQELYDRGGAYLDEDATSQARAARWLNSAYQEILNLQPWNFLKTFASGTDGTVSIPDLRRITLVTDIDSGDATLGPGRKLDYMSMEDLVDQGADLTMTGTPEFYWIKNVASTPVIVSWPLGVIIRVDYIKRVPTMTGTDVPIIPHPEYHDLIVDKAMIRVYTDNDNFEAAAAVRNEFNDGLAAMSEDYLTDSRDPEFLIPEGTDMDNGPWM